MIYTITFAPSIDYVPFVENFQTNALNRATKAGYYPGGKGINISRVLTKMQQETTALAYVGGFTGQFIEDFLSAEQVPTAFFQIEETTRINVKVKSEHETELNGPAPYLAAEKIDALIHYLSTHLMKEDWLIISGSIPKSVTNSFFEKVKEICDRCHAKWVLDTSGPRLAQLIAYKPYFIKPNAEEMSELLNSPLIDEEQLIEAAEKLRNDYDLPMIIVSLGGKGALCVAQQQVIIAAAPKGQVVNTVGAGDSLVAGVVAKLAQQQSVATAFQYGVAAGSATAFQEDLANAQQIEAVVEQVHIQFK